MNKLYILMLFAIFAIYNQCSNRKTYLEKTANDYFGKKIVFSDSLIYLYQNLELPLSYSNVNSTEPKIITIINGNCSSCLEQIRSWETLRQFSIKTYGEDYILFIIINSNLPYFKKFYYPDIPPDYQIIIDKHSDFIIENDINDLVIFDTFLLNEKNEIKLIGNPMNNEDLYNLYLNNITN